MVAPVATRRARAAPPTPFDERSGAAEGRDSAQVTSRGAEPIGGGGEGRECESMNEKCRAPLPPAQRLRAAAGSARAPRSPPEPPGAPRALRSRRPPRAEAGSEAPRSPVAWDAPGAAAPEEGGMQGFSPSRNFHNCSKRAPKRSKRAPKHSQAPSFASKVPEAEPSARGKSPEAAEQLVASPCARSARNRRTLVLPSSSSSSSSSLAMSIPREAPRRSWILRSWKRHALVKKVRLEGGKKKQKESQKVLKGGNRC